jgi:Putative restriction endonuclease
MSLVKPANVIGHDPELGFFQNRRVQLIEGEIIEWPVSSPQHVMSIGLTGDALRTAFGTGFHIRTRLPLNLGIVSDAAPDLAVVPGNPRDFTDHPTNALLVVEVSETTLNFDRFRKGSLYAYARIADYWIVNLVDRQLEVYRDPVPYSNEPSGFRYNTRTDFVSSQSATTFAAPDTLIAVADLLP